MSTTLLPRLESVDLPAVEASAALLKRRDRKYLLDPDAAQGLLGSLGAGMRVLEIDGIRSFRYESVYFDTPDLDAYLAAARSRPRRVKVRTRSYLDAGLCALELKQRTRGGLTIKDRHRYPLEQRTWLSHEAAVFLTSTGVPDIDVERLVPALTITFRRTTLFDPAAASRATIDTDLWASTPDGDCVEAEDLTIVETKSPAKATAIDRLLWESHHRPTKFSKYCTLLAAIDPRLPANKWHRTLRTRFAWEPVRSDAAHRNGV